MVVQQDNIVLLSVSDAFSQMLVEFGVQAVPSPEVLFLSPVSPLSLSAKFVIMRKTILQTRLSLTNEASRELLPSANLVFSLERRNLPNQHGYPQATDDLLQDRPLDSAGDMIPSNLIA